MTRPRTLPVAGPATPPGLYMEGALPVPMTAVRTSGTG